MEMVKTAGRSVVEGEGEEQRNSSSEKMHLGTLFGTGYTRDVCWINIHTGR